MLMLTTCMVGVWLLKLWYLTMLNAIYGFVAYIVAHMVFFSEDGRACSLKPTHEDRHKFLLAELIFFYVLFGISTLFVLAFPQMAFEIAHGAWRKR